MKTTKTLAEIEAYRRAEGALSECLSALKPCQVSVETDYHVGEAISRVENALLDLQHAAAA